MWDLLQGLTLAMAPILSFTADEIWEYIPGTGHPESVHLASFPSPPPGFPDEALLAKYDFLLKVRGEINRSLEEARKEKRLATAQEATVILGTMDGQLYDKLKAQAAELKTLAQVAELGWNPSPGRARNLKRFPGCRLPCSRRPGRNVSAAGSVIQGWGKIPTIPRCAPAAVRFWRDKTCPAN